MFVLCLRLGFHSVCVNIFFPCLFLFNMHQNHVLLYLGLLSVHFSLLFFIGLCCHKYEYQIKGVLDYVVVSMRTKSKACHNNKCAGLSDVLDDRCLNLPEDHVLVPESPLLGNHVLDLQRSQKFHQANECAQLLENHTSQITNMLPYAATSFAPDSVLLSPDFMSQDSPATSCTGCVTRVQSEHFDPPATQLPLSSLSSVPPTSASHTPLLGSTCLGFTFAVLDFQAGVVHPNHYPSSSVGLQLLGNDVLQHRYVVHPRRNVRPSAGIVITGSDCPSEAAQPNSNVLATADFKGKGKAKVDYTSTMDVQPTYEPSLMDVEPPAVRLADEDMLDFETMALSVDDDMLEGVLDAVGHDPPMSFSPMVSQIQCQPPATSYDIDPHVTASASHSAASVGFSRDSSRRLKYTDASSVYTPVSLRCHQQEPAVAARTGSPTAGVSDRSARAHARRESDQRDGSSASHGRPPLRRARAKKPRLFVAHEDALPNDTTIRMQGPPAQYKSFGSCTYRCSDCQALFWLDERIVSCSTKTRPVYHRCCLASRVKLYTHSEYPPYIRQLFSDRRFMENIRPYNQMFSMTSLGATVDESVNNGRGPYVFKVPGHIYHWIGGLCPSENSTPRFLQLYIYDTENEVQNRLGHFTGDDRRQLDPQIVDGLIHFLDAHNALVQLFRTAREKMLAHDIPEFKVRVFSVIGRNQYELPTSDSIGAIVYGSGPETGTDFDVIIEKRPRDPQRINKLHPCYMAFQFPLLFVYGEQGYHVNLKLNNRRNDNADTEKNMSMNAYYAYQIHDRFDRYSLLTRGGRLFQQYVVTAYCSIEQSRTDFLRHHQDYIRGEYLSGLYDAITRG